MSTSSANVNLIAGLIRDIPDFPKPGVVFKDITGLLQSPGGFSKAIVEMVKNSPQPDQIDLVVGTEARGFIFAAPVALALGAAFAPVRKPGKLPAETVQIQCELEYGTTTLVMHKDAVKPGQRVLIVDDVLATGGTVVATANLIQQLGGTVAGISVLMSLDFLHPNDAITAAGLPEPAAVLHY